MTPRRTKDRLAPLDEALREIDGRVLSAAERDAFGRYLDLLMRWNRTHDLTACRTEAEVVTALFRDSLLFLRVIGGRTDDPGMRALDIGPGAGVPGLPVLIVRPSLRLWMVESRRKRVSFLRAVRRELALSNVEVIEGRAEDVISDHPDLKGKYGVVLGRGVPPANLLIWALPYLDADGLVVAGGPPRPSDLPPAAGYSGVEWRREWFAALGIERTFLVARRRSGQSTVPRGTEPQGSADGRRA